MKKMMIRGKENQGDINKLYPKDNAAVTNINSRHLQSNDQLNEISFILKKNNLYKRKSN